MGPRLRHSLQLKAFKDGEKARPEKRWIGGPQDLGEAACKRKEEAVRGLVQKECQMLAWTWPNKKFPGLKSFIRIEGFRLGFVVDDAEESFATSFLRGSAVQFCDEVRE
eukprot:2896814-Pleurochrysis_carterae.AAC.1